MPEHGYTPMIEAILDHENIAVRLETWFDRNMADAYDHIFWSGPLDGFF